MFLVPWQKNNNKKQEKKTTKKQGRSVGKKRLNIFLVGNLTTFLTSMNRRNTEHLLPEKNT